MAESSPQIAIEVTSLGMTSAAATASVPHAAAVDGVPTDQATTVMRRRSHRSSEAKEHSSKHGGSARRRSRHASAAGDHEPDPDRRRSKHSHATSHTVDQQPGKDTPVTADTTEPADREHIEKTCLEYAKDGGRHERKGDDKRALAKYLRALKVGTTDDSLLQNLHTQVNTPARMRS